MSATPAEKETTSVVVISPEAPPGETTVGAVVGKAALFGFGGWAAENMLYGERFSGAFGKHKIPFLPIYAAGGLSVVAIAPHIAHLPWPVRMTIYATLLGGMEYVGCQLDRKFLKNRAWDYGENDALAEETKGCVDVKHTLLWAAAGLIAEKLA